MNNVNHNEKGNLQCTIKIMKNHYLFVIIEMGKCEVEEHFKNPYLSVMLAVIRPNLFWDFYKLIRM